MRQIANAPSLKRRRQQGVTLVELLVALPLALAIVLAVASIGKSMYAELNAAGARADALATSRQIMRRLETAMMTRDTSGPGFTLSQHRGSQSLGLATTRMVNGVSEETSVTSYCAALRHSVPQFDSVCGLSCAPGSYPVTEITVERTGSVPKTQKYPDRGLTSVAGFVAGVVTCFRDEGDSISIKTSAYWDRGEDAVEQISESFVPKSMFMRKGATLVK